MPKDLAIVQLQKQPDRVDPDTGIIQKNRYLSLRQMGLSPKSVTGIHNLAQYITKLLLTTQGTDLFDPNYGSSILRILRDPQSMADLQDIKAQMAMHVRDVKRQVIQSQTTLGLPPDERLKDLLVVRSEFFENELKFEVDIKVVSEAGTARELKLDSVVEA
jgi:hypothetical protein